MADESFVPGPTGESYLDEEVETTGESPETDQEHAHAAEGATPASDIESARQHEETAPTERVAEDL